ncbi:MAG: dienelactone hydrolase family protein [Chloroflexota bacterium]
MKTLLKWLGRILLVVLALLLLLVILGAGFIFYDSVAGATADELTNVTYTGPEGQSLNGYLAEPEGAGPHPGVLLIHEWWGLNEGITVLADALAREGYVVLAPDAYRNRTTSMVPRALWMTLTTPEDQIFSDVDGALAYLIGLDGVDPERVATMGFCFGGGHSLQLGMRQSQSLALTIIYYGALVTDPNLLRPLTEAQPVLGVFAGDDAMITRENVLEFEAALNSLNIENEITIYDGQPHGFLSEENYDQPGAARDAWQQTLAFLEKNFGD